MPDYANSKIYKITSEKGSYVGSTTMPLSTRLSKYLTSYKRAMAGKYHYCSSFEVIHEAEERIEITLIEAFPCENKAELKNREAKLIRETDCINDRRRRGKTPLQELIHDLTTDYRKRRSEYSAKRYPEIRERERSRHQEFMKLVREARERTKPLDIIRRLRKGKKEA